MPERQANIVGCTDLAPDLLGCLIDELQQQLLKDGCYEISLPNRDPNDLARIATVTASSAMPQMESQHIIDGYTRIENGDRHAWQPLPLGPLPQWVELSFGKDVSFNCAHVAFQTKNHATDSFRIEVLTGDEWQTVATITGNTQRRRVIWFDRTTSPKLRLVLTKARDTMAVCEVRVYDEPTE